MAGVIIDSGPIEATDKLDYVPQNKWRTLMVARRLYMKDKLNYDCGCLVEFIDDAKKMYSVLGFGSAAHMIREGYNLVPEEIDVAVQWLRLNPPRYPLALDEAITLAQREIGIEGGKPGPGRGHKTGDNITRLKRGTSRTYILARLDRDGHTALAAKVRDRKLSANAAAIEAGFRKKPVKHCPNCGHEW